MRLWNSDMSETAMMMTAARAAFGIYAKSGVKNAITRTTNVPVNQNVCKHSSVLALSDNQY